MSRKHRAAVVGLGRAGAGYEGESPPRSHLGAILAHPELELVAICDADAGALQSAIERWNWRGFATPDVAELAVAQPLELITVAVPPGPTPEVLGRVLELEPGAILLEKPMACDAAGAVQLNRLLVDADLPVAVSYTRCWDRSHARFRDRLMDEEATTLVRGLYSKGLFNYGSHMVAFLMQCFGSVEQVSARPAQAAAAGPDPSLVFDLEWRGGLTAYLIGVDKLDFDLFELEFLGSSGVRRLEAGGCRQRSLVPRAGLFYPGYAQLEETPTGEAAGRLDGLTPALDDLVARLRGRPGGPGCDWRFGLQVVAVLEAARRSAAAGGRAERPR